jgi:nitrate reductase beta subunit
MYWNNVETKPFGGYPHNWDAKILDLLNKANPGEQRWTEKGEVATESPFGQFNGQTIFEAAEKYYSEAEGAKRVLGYLPTDREWSIGPNNHEETAIGDLFSDNKKFGGSAQLPDHKVWFFYLQRLCNHCTYPGCLAACPRGAIYKRPEDGIVLIDQARCNGYRKCVEACPYKKAMYRTTTRTSEKCVGCYPRIEGKDPELSPNGEPLETRCMSVCPGRIRMQGLVAIDDDGKWVEDRWNPLYFMIRERPVALPLYPQFGTEPNGFYIPPRWVPRGYLKQMFGPGVESAIEQYSCPDRDLLAVMQLFRTTQQIIFRYEVIKGKKVAEIEVTMPDGSSKAQEIFNDTVIGYNKFGVEAVRVTVEEPTFERPAELHVNSI